MDFFDAQHQAPSPQWAQMTEAAARTKPNDDEAELIRLREQVQELEATVADYEALLAELPSCLNANSSNGLNHCWSVIAC